MNPALQSHNPLQTAAFPGAHRAAATAVDARRPTPDIRETAGPMPGALVGRTSASGAGSTATEGWPAIPANRRRFRDRDGIALVLTLGLMAMMAILVVGFTLTVRLDRLSARNYRDQVVARQYAQVALDRAMEMVDWALSPEKSDNPSYGGRLAPFGDSNIGWWFHPDDNTWFSQQTPTAVTSPGPHPPPSAFPTHRIRLFQGSATNLVPAALWEEALPLEAEWTYILSTNDNPAISTATTVTNGRIAFMVLDVSGFLDASHLSSNMFDSLPERRAFHFDAHQAKTADFSPFHTVGDLASVVARPNDPNRSINPPISNLIHFSYDPGPEVWAATNAPGLGDARYPYPEKEAEWLHLGSRAIEADLSLRFNVNSLIPMLQSGVDEDRYSGSDFDAYFGKLVSHMAASGISDPKETAWNIVNALDDYDYIPRSDSETPWREHYGIKPTPRINEFVLFEVPSDARATEEPENFPVPNIRTMHSNHYALAVEACPSSPTCSRKTMRNWWWGYLRMKRMPRDSWTSRTRRTR